jgi:AbiV family abortive infection protein
LAVLSLEEVGKLMVADGLLFARSGDERSKRFEKGLRSHTLKLAALDLFPFLVQSLSVLDPRYQTEEQFRQALAITLESDRSLRSELAQWLGQNCSLTKLDEWKQKGFYAHAGAGGVLQSPQQAVPADLSKKIVLLAKRLVGTLDFLLRDNLERYADVAAKVRQNVSEDELRALRDAIENLISVDSNQSSSEPMH